MAPPLPSTPSKVSVLPTFERLGVDQSDLKGIDESAIVRTWFATFSAAVEAGSVADVTKHFVPISGAWRDLLGLSWDFRTLHGHDHIQSFLEENLASSGLSKLKLEDGGIELQKAAEDLVWLIGTCTSPD